MKHALSWNHATVVAVQDITPTVREFLLRPADQAPTRWDAGAHLQVQVAVNAKVQMRHYSLVGQTDGLHWRIAVKRIEGGRGGSAAMWTLQVGDTLPVSGPHNHFALDGTAPGYLLIAGGIGITPLVAMAQRLQTQATGNTSVTMLYGARSADELAYANLLRQVLGGQLHTFVAEAGERMDFAVHIAALPARAQLYTCGPVHMLEAVRKAWVAEGRRLADLRFETFGSTGSAAAQTFTVRVPRHAIDIAVPADITLLDALEAAGIETISDCRRGECGLCVMDVLAVNGEIDHRDVFLSEHEKQQGTRICTCVSRVVGEITLDSAWRHEV